MKYLSMQKQPRHDLICDTNVWYDIAQNGNKSIKGKLNKVATYVNIDELSISPNLLTDYDLVQKAIIAILKNYKDAIIDNPNEFLIKLDNSDYVSYHYNEHYQSILKFTQDIANKKGVPNEEVVRPVIENRREELDKIAELINDRNEIIRENVKRNLIERLFTKSSYRKMDTIELTKETIRRIVSIISPGNYTLSADFPWGKIELFLHTLDYVFKDMALSKRKWKANDWYDFFNLVYVKPGDKYLTHEKYINRMIKGARMEKYIYTT
jgi:hypothetical protein